MKVFIISFGPNPRIVAKFQTHRFRTFGENRGEKINKLEMASCNSLGLIYITVFVWASKHKFQIH